MQRHRFILFFTLFFLLGHFSLHAQTVEQLKKQRLEIEKRINETNKLLKSTQSEEKSVLNKITLLQRNLSERKSLIDNYKQELDAFDREINKLTAERIELERKLEKQKADYARLIQKTQVSRSEYSKMMFLLSSKSFEQSVRRLRYLQQFADYRKDQVKMIDKLKTEITLKTDSLNAHRVAKEEALKGIENETLVITQSQRNEKKLLANLQTKEKKLLNEYQTHQNKKAQIDRKIQEKIEEEIRKAEERRRIEEARLRAEAEAKRKAEEERKRAAELAKSKAEDKKVVAKAEKATETKVETKAETKAPASTPAPVSTIAREEKLISNNFAGNKGKLPWPVASGSISGRFGVQNHADWKYVQVNNKGTYFRSPAGTDARAVFDGIVGTVFSLPGSGSAVIVQHGTYRTVYSNLSTVYVKEGDKVSTKQAIGKIYTNSTNQAEMQFQIYQDRNLLNPEAWLTK